MTSGYAYAATSAYEGEEAMLKIGFTRNPAGRFPSGNFVIIRKVPDERDTSVAGITAGRLEQAILRFCRSAGAAVDEDTLSGSTELIRFDAAAKERIKRRLHLAIPEVREFLELILALRWAPPPHTIRRGGRRVLTEEERHARAEHRDVVRALRSAALEASQVHGADFLGRSRRFSPRTGMRSFAEPMVSCDTE